MKNKLYFPNILVTIYNGMDMVLSIYIEKNLENIHRLRRVL